MKYLLPILFSFFICCCTQIPAATFPFIKGFNVTEDGETALEISHDERTLSPAQKTILEAKRLGANHIVFNPRAYMLGPYTSEIVPIFPQGLRVEQVTERFIKFITWVKKQNITVQIRPILFVVNDPESLSPFYTVENGIKKIWWHGNIQPVNPQEWFKSLQAYHDIYLNISKKANVDFYTIGAELYSMTVGIKGEWNQFPNGFPQNWLRFLEHARDNLPRNTQIMYDMTFTDDTVKAPTGLSVQGGEFERWHQILVEQNLDEQNPNRNDLILFWKKLDYIGIDIYRSLATKTDHIPSDYKSLVTLLKRKTDLHFSQLDSSLTEIEFTLNTQKPIIYKEIGYRSSQNAFIDPFAYDNPSEKTNISHQAAAYEAFFSSYFSQASDWLKGVAIWDLGLNSKRRGERDNGFTPLGKKSTEKIIIDFFSTQN